MSGDEAVSHFPVRAVVPGSYDPITRGHLDIITRAAGIFGEVIVAVGQNTTKNYLFDSDERLRLVRNAVADIKGVRVERLSGLLTDFCTAQGARVIVKGVRFGSDFDYELQMSQLNNALSGIETMLREVAHNGGDISPFVTPEVNAAVLSRLV